MAEPTLDVIMRFPNEIVKKEFFIWLCDSGGEDAFLEYAEMHIPEEDVSEIQYHPVNKEYPPVFGGFLEDNLVIVHTLPE